jgi:hypothetical protein
MRKLYTVFITLFLFITAGTIYFFLPKENYSHRVPFVIPVSEEELEGKDEDNAGEKKDGYDGPAARMQQEFDWTVDPALGYVPYTRLNSALAYTHYLRDSVINSRASGRTQSIMLWQERGPIYDSVGPSNGNTRGNDLYTSGRMAAVLIDTLNDPTGNTAIVGGVSGGVWKCTNFLSNFPNWKIVNDYFDNMAISSICQDPTNPSVMYFSTGEASSNADAHFGFGVWKSTDKGETWQQLPSTVNFIRNWKIICDPAGNVYLASRTTATPALNTSGLLRSNDGGATWTNITPTAQGTATASATCTDIEYTSTGKLVGTFGYATGGTTLVRVYTTNIPSTVTQATGWTLASGLRTSGLAVGRFELAALGDIVYAVAVNGAANSDSCYKSVDGGANWVKQNTTIMPAGVLNGQGWYNVTLSINPDNSNELICGGLDAYRSTNGGATWTRLTFWVTTIPYVHADHHYMHWWKRGNQSQVVIGCDGGIYYSTDGGVVWVDKNRNLGLKQFYGADIHPAAGSPYLIAGAQDNGTHQLKNPGNSYSIEVTGGDGMHVWINQQDPTVQFGSYVYNQYRRSVNGGQTWTSNNISGSIGMFVNPYAYDDAQNTLYACHNANTLLRWPNANTATTSNTVTIAALNGAQIGSLKVSPYTANRLFLGSNGGRVIRVDNANAATPTATNISGASFPAGFVRSVNVGSSDNNIVATFSNFGVAQVWTTTDGGTNWTNIDGNLPDMPVWWALYDPNNNNKLYIATETGVWATDQINGASTVWVPDPGLPTTRIAMLRMRSSDNTVVASTYGRGLWTARIPPSTPEISFVLPSSAVTEQSTGTIGCRNYKDYIINTGIVNNPTGDATVTYSVAAGNTAIRGVDFDFTTNGNFSTPSTQHVFSSGATGLKPITVRIYDDAEVESTESFTLTYTISGTTNALSGPVNAHTVTIFDNDRAPIPFGTGNYTIGNYTTDMSSLNTPFDATKLKHRLQVIYRASELQASGMSISAVINSIKLKVKTKNTTQPFKNFSIQIANTYKINLAAGFITGIPFTQVYSGDYATVVGDNTFNFSTPFTWDGTSSVVIQFCFDNTGGTAEGVTDVVEGKAAAFGAGVRASVYSNHTTSTNAGCALAAAFLDDNRVNTSFEATFGDPVATALNSEKTESLGSKNDLFYYTGSGQIMARVLNLSDHNYGCTQVIIDRAGTGVKQFWNTNTGNYLMDKTFRILPTTNNASGRYEVTFYFTKAEKEGWEAATGKPWDSIQIIKLPSRISNVTPANAQPDGPGTIKVIDAVKRSFGPNYFTLSGIFETGFSGYGFGVAGRMNTLLVLNGQISGPNINLTWTTSAEINSSVFDVEKSYDGITFHRIGTLQAAGNKLSSSTYNSTDPENVQYNYYRIKMQHSDGYVLYSNTIFIRKDDAPQRLFISPNPFTNYITARLSRPVTNTVVIFDFYDTKGALVKRYIGPSRVSSYTINTNDLLSSAVYVLKVSYGETKLVKTILKK